MARSGEPRGASTAPEPPALRPPPLLQRGDRVALISPSSHQGRTPERLLPGAVEILQSWGLRVEPEPGEEPRHLYLAGDDRHRAESFQRAYLDPEIRALFATRGGYGAARMLPLLEREPLAAAPPKHVVGCSDTTALLAYLNGLGIQAVHGPCLATANAQDEPRSAESREALRTLLFGGAPGRRFDLTPWAGRPLSAPLRGRLVGGNLSVWATTLGTPWEPDCRGAILFLEDVDEAPYRIDRMLTHLRTAGKLEGARAVVFGHLSRCDGEPPELLDRVLRDLFAEADFPVLGGMTAGHGDPNIAFPLGAVAELSPSRSGEDRPMLTIG